MAFLVIGWPITLVFYVIGDVSKATDDALHVSPATIVLLLVAHVALVLGLQVLGTIRSAKSWAKRQADRRAAAEELAARPIPAHELADDDAAVMRAQRKRLDKWRKKESKRAAKRYQRLGSVKSATEKDTRLLSDLGTPRAPSSDAGDAAPATPVCDPSQHRLSQRAAVASTSTVAST